MELCNENEQRAARLALARLHDVCHECRINTSLVSDVTGVTYTLPDQIDFLEGKKELDCKSVFRLIIAKQLVDDMLRYGMDYNLIYNALYCIEPEFPSRYQRALVSLIRYGEFTVAQSYAWEIITNYIVSQRTKER